MATLTLDKKGAAVRTIADMKAAYPTWHELATSVRANLAFDLADYWEEHDDTQTEQRFRNYGRRIIDQERPHSDTNKS